jgi:hypothetical protein
MMFRKILPTLAAACGLLAAAGAAQAGTIQQSQYIDAQGRLVTRTVTTSEVVVSHGLPLVVHGTPTTTRAVVATAPAATVNTTVMGNAAVTSSAGIPINGTAAPVIVYR